MTVIDSSGWVEMFTDGPRAGAFLGRLQAAEGVIVPTVVLYEVYKILYRETTVDQANLAAARLRQYHRAPLDEQLALEAADFSLQHGLPMADAIIYATARAHDATLVTSDVHFADLPGVDYLPAAP